MKKAGNDTVNLTDFRKRLADVSKGDFQKNIEMNAGLAPNELSRIFSGQKALSVDHLVKLANAYNCSIDYLLTGSRKAAASPDPTYADLLRCVDALTSIGAAALEDHAITVCDNTGTERTERQEVRKALVFYGFGLSDAFDEYSRIQDAAASLNDPKTAGKIKSLWFDKELENNFDLNENGLLWLYTLRTQGPLPEPEEID